MCSLIIAEEATAGDRRKDARRGTPAITARAAETRCRLLCRARPLSLSLSSCPGAARIARVSSRSSGAERVAHWSPTASAGARRRLGGVESPPSPRRAVPSCWHCCCRRYAARRHPSRSRPLWRLGPVQRAQAAERMHTQTHGRPESVSRSLGRGRAAGRAGGAGRCGSGAGEGGCTAGASPPWPTSLRVESCSRTARTRWGLGHRGAGCCCRAAAELLLLLLLLLLLCWLPVAPTAASGAAAAARLHRLRAPPHVAAAKPTEARGWNRGKTGKGERTCAALKFNARSLST